MLPDVNEVVVTVTLEELEKSIAGDDGCLPDPVRSLVWQGYIALTGIDVDPLTHKPTDPAIAVLHFGRKDSDG